MKKDENPLDESICISMDVMPRPQGRPRFRSNGNRVRIYQSHSDKRYKDSISLWAASQMRVRGIAGPLEGPLSLSLTFWMGDRANGIGYPIGPPDIDNLAKAVLDAFTGIVFHDDAQIIWLMCRKLWGPQGFMAVISRVDYQFQGGY